MNKFRKKNENFLFNFFLPLYNSAFNRIPLIDFVIINNNAFSTSSYFLNVNKA
jgi:hypothetical protein